MVNQQLIDYIKENLSGNISIGHIKKSLLDVGWSEHEIDEAISVTRGISSNKGTPSLPKKSPEKTSIIAILSLIFAFLFSPIGLILGIIALSEIKKNPPLKGRGLAIAGIIISIFFIMIYLILFIISYSAISGYLSPGIYLPSSCTLGVGLSCTNFEINGDINTIKMDVTNGRGEDLNSIKISIAGDCDGSTTGDGTLTDGEKETFIIYCSKDISDLTFKEDINIDYKSETGLTRKIRGSISTQVE